MITMFGIPNCDTIKKAKKWLSENNIDYQFHDYKKLSITKAEINKWIKQVGWEVILNKRGTTWRKLDDSVKESINQSSAIQLMLDNPSIIKRPVLNVKGKITVGFSPDIFSKLF